VAGLLERIMELKPTLDQAFNSASIGILSTDQLGNIAAINKPLVIWNPINV
jgi:hypothetical protein